MRAWVTVDDYILWSGAEPYVADDIAAIGACCDAVTGWIQDVRPDLVPPEATHIQGRGVFSALVGQIDPSMRSSTSLATVQWAALQLVRRWHDKRGNGQVAAFQELGFIPSAIDKDIEHALHIGRDHRPVVA